MLEQILQQMYEEALQKDQIPQKRKLKNNLHLSLTSHSQGMTFELSRDSTYPSVSEWKTCMKYFPYHVGSVEPIQCLSNGRLALRAELPNRRDKQLAF